MKTVPLKAADFLEYINGAHRDFTIDLSQASLEPRMVWNYLAFLKIDNAVHNLSREQLAAYISTRDFVRSECVIDIVKQVLHYHVHGELYSKAENTWGYDNIVNFCAIYEFLLNDLMRVLWALPVFLKVKSGEFTPLPERCMPAPKQIGVNFCHLFADNEFLVDLMPEVLGVDTTMSDYYSDLFDGYIYGGDNLVWFVTSNPNNILFLAMAPNE